MTELPSSDAVRDDVIAIVAKQTKLDVATIHADSTLKDLGVASLDAIEVIFDIEEFFDVTFPDQGTNFDTDTVQHLVDAVMAAQQAKAAGADGAT
ncbi:MAG: phosphopantetheine-binding protein [Rhodanobacter sp.]